MEADNTIQIRSNPRRDSELAIHADSGDGTPVCGTVNRDWRGTPMHYVSLGPGKVTCQRCKS